MSSPGAPTPSTGSARTFPTEQTTLDSVRRWTEELIDAQRVGFSLDQEFYCSEQIFEQDLRRLSERWSLVEHTSRIPHTGDHVVVNTGSESYIIVRGADDRIRAFHNVCRHRGSRICLEPSGNARRLTCPYHAWSYDLEGSLRGARDMGPDFDPGEFALKPVGVRVVEGLIFISPRASQQSFDEEYPGFAELLGFHGIASAKVAARKHYPTAANWKLVVENFLECYHCAPAHPEYSAVHSPQKLRAFGAGPGSGDDEAVTSFQPELDEWIRLAERLGHPTGMYAGSTDTPHMSQFGRTPIGAGNASETADGRLACQRLLGNIAESDGGQTGFSFSPIGFVLANCDYAFMITFTPVSSGHTDVVASWLVHEDAVEGTDYDLDHLTWVWDITLQQDKTITENNQLGVASSAYEPGPYAPSEARCRDFLRWYLNSLRDEIR